jgi:hypothetical protein
MAIEWGNVADWLGSVGTVAALLLGLLLLWREVRENRVRHASRVVAWIDDEAEAACVRNGGEKPVAYVMLPCSQRVTAPNHRVGKPERHLT